jgi:hypothetical protein
MSRSPRKCIPCIVVLRAVALVIKDEFTKRTRVRQMEAAEKGRVREILVVDVDASMRRRSLSA